MDNSFETTALDMRNEETLLSFGCPCINKIFRGGIDCCGITQFYGEAGTGKTQFALQLCLAVQLPLTDGGLDAGAIYICTEAAFPIRRLQQLFKSSDMSKKYNLNGDSIFVEHISTMEELELCLCKRIPLLMAARKIGLIVLDSVTAPYRVEDWDDEEKKRTKSLRIIGRQLHKLGSDKNVCVICLNQVTAVIGFNNLTHQQTFQPCLGITWSSMVTTSICLYKTGTIRKACVVLSSRIPSTSFPFVIKESGVMGVN